MKNIRFLPIIVEAAARRYRQEVGSGERGHALLGGPDGLFEKGFGYVCQSLTGLPVDHFLGYIGPFSCHFRVDLGSLLALFCLRFAILLYPFDNFSPR